MQQVFQQLSSLLTPDNLYKAYQTFCSIVEDHETRKAQRAFYTSLAQRDTVLSSRTSEPLRWELKTPEAMLKEDPVRYLTPLHFTVDAIRSAGFTAGAGVAWDDGRGGLVRWQVMRFATFAGAERGFDILRGHLDRSYGLLRRQSTVLGIGRLGQRGIGFKAISLDSSSSVRLLDFVWVYLNLVIVLRMENQGEWLDDDAAELIAISLYREIENKWPPRPPNKGS